MSLADEIKAAADAVGRADLDLQEIVEAEREIDALDIEYAELCERAARLRAEAAKADVEAAERRTRGTKLRAQYAQERLVIGKRRDTAVQLITRCQEKDDGERSDVFQCRGCTHQIERATPVPGARQEEEGLGASPTLLPDDQQTQWIAYVTALQQALGDSLAALTQSAQTYAATRTALGLRRRRRG